MNLYYPLYEKNPAYCSAGFFGFLLHSFEHLYCLNRAEAHGDLRINGSGKIYGSGQSVPSSS